MKLPGASGEPPPRDPLPEQGGKKGLSCRVLTSIPRRQKAGCILLVEDREDDALLLKRTLRKAGFTMPVRILQDGEPAIAYLRGDPPFSDRKRYPLPSILMLDIYLPNKSGFEVLKWLRAQAQFRDLFVAVLTGTGKIDDIAQAYRLGANSFLTKPCRAEDIRNLAQSFPAYWTHEPQRRKDAGSERTRLSPPNVE